MARQYPSRHALAELEPTGQRQAAGITELPVNQHLKEEPWAPQGPAAWYPVGEDGTVRLRIRAERSGGVPWGPCRVLRRWSLALWFGIQVSLGYKVREAPYGLVRLKTRLTSAWAVCLKFELYG